MRREKFRQGRTGIPVPHSPWEIFFLGLARYGFYLNIFRQPLQILHPPLIAQIRAQSFPHLTFPHFYFPIVAFSLLFFIFSFPNLFYNI